MREQLHNNLINGLSALQYTAGGQNLFTEVKRIFVDFPTAYPVCEVVNSKTEYNLTHNTGGEVTYLFDLYIVDDFSTVDNSQVEIDTKIARLNAIEKTVLKYLLQLPSNPDITSGITDGTVTHVTIDGSSFAVEADDIGFKLVLTITVRIITLQNLLS